MARNPANRGRPLSVEAVGLQEYRRALLGFPRHLREQVVTEIKDAAAPLRQEMRERSSTGPLQKRSGRLMRSWSIVDLSPKHALPRLALKSFSYYAIKHEEGWTERGVPWIWIPTDANVRVKARTGSQAIVSPTEARDRIAAGLWRYSTHLGPLRPITSVTDFSRLHEARIGGEKIQAARPRIVLDETGAVMYLLVRYIQLDAVLGLTETGKKHLPSISERLANRAAVYWQEVA
jgi:hypothetical protein